MRQLRRASRDRRAVKCEVEKGRLESLFEFTDSLVRLTSSNPIVSGSFVSLLKFAFSSSSALLRMKTRESKIREFLVAFVKIKDCALINIY